MSAAAAAALRRNQAALHPPSEQEVAAGSTLRNRPITEPDIEGLGHRDRQTEQLERALRRLGSSDTDAAMPDASAHGEAHSSGSSVAATEQPAVQETAEQQILQEDTAVEQVSPAVEEPLDASQPAVVQDPSIGAESRAGKTAANRPQKAAGADEENIVEPDALGAGADDSTSTSQRFRQAERAVHELKAAAISQEEASTALLALQTILRNALNAPQDDRYRRLRPRNPAFARRLGRFPQAIEVLHVAGFHEDARGNEGPVLSLQRTDPGLLWLALEAVQTAMASG